MRGALASYGPSVIKKTIWDREYSSGKWTFNDDTAHDCLYPYLEEFARNGSILDIGCGSGNTANELTASVYSTYCGVDISAAALDKARRRSEANGRSHKNTFLRADFLKYVPDGRFDLILFRESLYHVPLGSIKATLDRYANHLADTGVFIVRMATKENGKGKARPLKMLRAIETGFNVVKQGQHGESAATVIVFRPAPLLQSRGQ
jgi:SAM-dependent methyltransferase